MFLNLFTSVSLIIYRFFITVIFTHDSTFKSYLDAERFFSRGGTRVIFVEVKIGARRVDRRFLRNTPPACVVHIILDTPVTV